MYNSPPIWSKYNYNTIQGDVLMLDPKDREEEHEFIDDLHDLFDKSDDI